MNKLLHKSLYENYFWLFLRWTRKEQALRTEKDLMAQDRFAFDETTFGLLLLKKNGRWFAIACSRKVDRFIEQSLLYHYVGWLFFVFMYIFKIYLISSIKLFPTSWIFYFILSYLKEVVKLFFQESFMAFQSEFIGLTSLSSSSKVNSFFFTTLSWLRKLNSAAFFWSLANLFSYFETFLSVGLTLKE